MFRPRLCPDSSRLFCAVLAEPSNYFPYHYLFSHRPIRTHFQFPRTLTQRKSCSSRPDRALHRESWHFNTSLFFLRIQVWHHRIEISDLIFLYRSRRRKEYVSLSHGLYAIIFLFIADQITFDFRESTQVCFLLSLKTQAHPYTHRHIYIFKVVAVDLWLIEE